MIRVTVERSTNYSLSLLSDRCVTPCKEMKNSHFKSISDLNHLAHLPNTPFWRCWGPGYAHWKLVFSQVIDSLPMHTFRRGVARYDGNRYKKTFSCLDQYLRMTFAQSRKNAEIGVSMQISLMH